MHTPQLATIVFPARTLSESVSAWSTVFGTGPAFSSDGIEKAADSADFAVFNSGGLEIGLTSLPWVDGPLLFLATDDLDATRAQLIAAGAAPLAEGEGGRLGVLGTAPVVNGDPRTGIVDVPGARLAAIRLADGSTLGLRQTLA